MHRKKCIALIIVTMLCLMISPFFGAYTLEWKQIWHDPLQQQLLFELRLPRVVLAAVAGGILAITGLSVQAMIRNPLAEPYTLGIASGSALAVAIYFYTGWQISWWWFNGITLFALIGAIVVASVILISTRFNVHSYQILLLGIMINFICSSLISLIHLMSGAQNSYRLQRWVFGTLELTSPLLLWQTLPILLLGSLILILHMPHLNLLATDIDVARTRGLSLQRTLIILYATIMVLIAFIVTLCGPIGFVGLIIPHLCRLWIGDNHRQLWLICILTGAIFLMMADILARTVLAPAEIPIGIITILCGSPLFIFLLYKQTDRSQ